MKYLKMIVERGPIGWYRRLLNIVRNFNYVVMYVESLRKDIEQATHYIKRATKLHVDVKAGEKLLTTTVILCGRYRGKDHVQVFNLPLGNMSRLIEDLKHAQRAGEIVTVDAPIGLDATIKRELKT